MTEQPKDRQFNPSRIPATDQSRQLVSEVLTRLERAEARARKRRPDDQATYERSVAALVCDVVHRQLTEPQGWVVVEMSKAALAPSERRAPFLTEKFRDLVHQLRSEKVGLLEYQEGRRTPFGGVRSTVRPASHLWGLIDELGLSLGDFGQDPVLLGAPLELRGEKVLALVGGKRMLKAPRLPLPETPEVEALRCEVDQINCWIAQANLGWLGNESEDRVDLGRRFLKRIFNNGSLEAGGRLYGGFWQDLSSEQRLDRILIDDEPVVSLDFAQSAMRQAYGEVSVPLPPGDLYGVPGLTPYRSETKVVLNALLSADQLPVRFPHGARGRMPASWKFGQVYRLIARHHEPIVSLFGTSRGFHFMYQESQVLIRVLLKLKELGVVGLPIHDCILVPQSKAMTAKELMEATFHEVTGVAGLVEIDGTLLQRATTATTV